MAAKKSGANTVKAGQTTAKAAKKTAETTKKSAEFVAKHWKGSLIALGLLMVVAFLLSTVSSCSMLVQGGVSAIGASSYATTDDDMKAAEAQYCALEDELREYLDNYESTHDYDEYHYDLDDIEHDPYVLVSILSAILLIVLFILIAQSCLHSVPYHLQKIPSDPKRCSLYVGAIHRKVK